VLPAMPALAVLCALNWDWISRKAFVVSLIAAGVVIALLAYYRFVADSAAGRSALSSGILDIAGGRRDPHSGAVFIPEFTRPTVTAGITLVYLCFAAFLRLLRARWAA